MNEYLAKSNPKETIEEHTGLMLDNLKKFCDINPEFELDVNLLREAIIYHDMGKINDKFQNKIRGIKNTFNVSEIPHGHLSICFIDFKNVFKDSYYTNDEIEKYINCDGDDTYKILRKKILAAAIYYHHDRENISDRSFEIRDLMKLEIDKLKDIKIEFNREDLKDIKIIKVPSNKYFDFSLSFLSDVGEYYKVKKSRVAQKQYVIIKGLLNKIDYASSAHEIVDIKNDFLEEHMENVLSSFKKNNPNAEWNNLQKYMLKNKDNNVVAIAQTGMGKTEAGLLWIGNNKGFFTLPLKTAINSIYDRVRGEIKDGLTEKVALLHSDMSSRYLSIKDDYESSFTEENIDLEEYITRTKQFSMPLTICTADQIFDFVYKYNGCEIKMATLAYSKVIIDEIQMYSPEVLAVIILALEWLVDLGGKFCILTATLPPFVLDELSKRNIDIKPQVFIDDKKVRHSIKVIKDSIYSEFILEKFDNNKILVICNTVKQAQKIYRELKQHEELEGKVNIFHNSFIKKDRNIKEEKILKFTEKDNVESGIWIATQVAEASLDVDFDMLVTELSDINGLLQRMGRCYRKREFNGEGYNCFVFDGGDGKTSGVYSRNGKGVIEETIFNLSKESLEGVDGKLTESKKLDLINSIYCSEKIKKTDYYRKYIDRIEYINSLNFNELGKKETKEMLREIKSTDIIPKSVYDENEEKIKAACDVLSKSIKNFDNEYNIKKIKEDKIRAREVIRDLMVSVPLSIFYSIDKGLVEDKKIYFNHTLKIVDIEYSSEYGLCRNFNKKVPSDIFIRMV